MSQYHLLWLIGIILFLAACNQSIDPEPRDEPVAASCVDGTFTNGALFRVCVPDDWRAGVDDLVLFSPGYTNPRNSLSIPDWQSGEEGLRLSDAIRLLGYGFATTSFRENGLLRSEWINEDLRLLVDRFSDEFGEPRHVYLIGFSQGGIITTLGIERYPDSAGEVFSGGLAACGPIGEFSAQFNYLGHFRVLFDAMFESTLEGWPVWSQNLENGDIGYVNQELINEWNNKWVPQLRALARDEKHAGTLDQLFDMTGAPVNHSSSYPMENTLIQVLWYAVFGTNDAIEKLGGMPFDNTGYIYKGSDDDAKLNESVERFQTTGPVLENMEAITATGSLQIPLVTMHTTGDEVVPNDHAVEFEVKVSENQSDRYHTHFEIDRYGHCNFNFHEILAAFTVLVDNVTAKSPVIPLTLFTDELQKSRYIELVSSYGVQPVITSD